MLLTWDFRKVMTLAVVLTVLNVGFIASAGTVLAEPPPRPQLAGEFRPFLNFRDGDSPCVSPVTVRLPATTRDYPVEYVEVSMMDGKGKWQPIAFTEEYDRRTEAKVVYAEYEPDTAAGKDFCTVGRDYGTSRGFTDGRQFKIPILISWSAAGSDGTEILSRKKRTYFTGGSLSP